MEVLPTDSSSRRRWLRGLFWTAIAGVILHTFAVGIWEGFARPGLSATGRIAFRLIGAISSSVRDQAYSSAALDPSAVAPLTLSMFFATLPVFVGVLVWFAEFGVPRLFARGDAQRREARQSKDKDIRERFDASFARRRRRLSVLLICLCAIEGTVTMTGAFLISHAVTIRRVFLCNVTRLAPSIPEAERRHMEALFASMTTRADYEAVSKELVESAKRAGVKILPTD